MNRRIAQRGRDGDVVLIQQGDEPIVEARHRDLAGGKRIEKTPARLAVFVNFEGVAVRFVLHHDPAATVFQRIGQNPDLLDAVGLVVDRTDDR